MPRYTRSGVSYTSRAPYAKSRASALTVAQRGAREAYYNKRRGYSSVARTRGPMSFGEMKYFNTELSSANLVATAASWAATAFVPNVGTPDTLVVPVVGAGLSNRVGRKIHLHKLRLHGTFNIPAQSAQAAADAPCKIRYVLVQDMQGNATQTLGQDVIAAATTGTAASQNNSFQSLATLGRFKIWKDKTIIMQDPNMANDTGATGGLVQNGLLRHFKINLVFKKPITINFNATNGGTFADVTDNIFTLLVHATSIAYAPTITYNARAYYKD